MLFGHGYKGIAESNFLSRYCKIFHIHATNHFLKHPDLKNLKHKLICIFPFLTLGKDCKVIKCLPVENMMECRLIFLVFQDTFKQECVFFYDTLHLQQIKNLNASAIKMRLWTAHLTQGLCLVYMTLMAGFKLDNAALRNTKLFH